MRHAPLTPRRPVRIRPLLKESFRCVHGPTSPVETLERRDLLTASAQLVVDVDVNADVRHRFVAGDSTYQIVEYKDKNGTSLSSVGRIDNGVPRAIEFSGSHATS